MFFTPAVVAKYDVVYPPAVIGYSSVDSRILGITTTFPPGHQAINPTITDKRTSRISLKQQKRNNLRTPNMLKQWCMKHLDTLLSQKYPYNK